MDLSIVENRRKLIDRRALQDGVLALFDADLSEGERRAAVLEAYKGALKAGFAEVERRFLESQDGAVAVRSNAFVVDQLIRVIHDVAVRKLYRTAAPTEEEKLCIAATGGYGRGELAPKSDVDLLFLYSYKLSARVEQIVEEILYTLWDLGLKVGHATRSSSEALRQAEADMTIRTALLEGRYIWGEKRFFTKLWRDFQAGIVEGSGPAFLEAKLQERDQRHDRMGDTRYVLEPNIKEGKGGLRDLHTLFWIAKYLYRVSTVAELVEQGVLTRAEARRFAKAQSYLWTLRCHLHYLTGRPEERLTFDVQPELARRMGYTDHAGAIGVERFMKHYFLIAKDVGDLTRIFCAAFEAQQQKKPLFSLSRLIGERDVEGFPIDGGRLNAERGRLAERPVDLLRLFEVAHRRGLDIHPNALKAVSRSLARVDRALREDAEANRLFMAVLTARRNPEVALRRMNECGLFGKFVPDFGRVVAQMQYDMYHVYTTDEHTIRAIGILSRIENGELEDDHPTAHEVLPKVLSRDALYVALLLHDIAKGRGGDHSEIGAGIARDLCPRLGLSEEETETVAWLVLHHLAMSEAAFKRDIDDPKTVQDFAGLVQSVERLRLLLCLTVADIRAVGPKVWNNWKATLLRRLYYQTEEVLTKGLDGRGREERADAVRAELAAALSGWDPEARDRHLARCPPGYLLANDLDHLVRHAEIVRGSEQSGQNLAFDSRADADRGVTEVVIHAPDHPGLFARLSGAIAVCGANIVDARIATFNDGMALDVFSLQDEAGGTFTSSSRLARMAVMVEQVLAGRVKPLEELARRASQLPSRLEVFTVAPRILIDNAASNTHTVVEVNGRDRPALLFRLTTALFRMGLQISTAKISTFGEQVVDVFYVKDVFGMKVTHEEKLKQIREGLLEVLAANARPEDASPPTGRIRAERAKAAAAE